ncbi:MAG: MotA/TolQ/ExbB proton channel family protein [Phascolarctobacterium sp.]|nr:MAG: MotA/TolQ/ExbB proton channel family protein [Phascolarctobacterium sp.]
MEAISSAVDYFYKGGYVMWPLLLCSVAVVAIGIERFLYYREVDSGNMFADEYCRLLAERKSGEACEFACCHKGHCAQLMAEAGKFCCCNQCRAYLETRSGIIIAKLRSNLNYLSIIVTMAPLLGLLGTICGMINSFSIFDLEEGAPMAITGGIGEALIATATGLCVAILALCVHSYFAHRMDTIITNMEQCFSALLEDKTRGEAL